VFCYPDEAAALSDAIFTSFSVQRVPRYGGESRELFRVGRTSLANWPRCRGIGDALGDFLAALNVGQPADQEIVRRKRKPYDRRLVLHVAALIEIFLYDWLADFQ